MGSQRHWVAHRSASRSAPVVASLIGVAAVAGASAFSVWSIERDLEQRTLDAARAAGVDTAEVDIDFSYRDGTVTGPLEAAAIDRIENTTGVRTVSFSDPAARAEPDDGPDDPVTSIAPETTSAPPLTTAIVTELGQVDVTAEVGPALISLSGSVHSDSQRLELVDAAAQRVGGANVANDLVVEQSGADGPLTGISTILAELPAGVTGTITLVGDNLSFVGIAPSSAAADELAELLDATGRITALELDIIDEVDDQTTQPSDTAAPETSVPDTTPTTTAPAPVGDVEELQSGLDALAPNIAENVVFASSSDDLNDAAANALNDVVDLMNEYPELSLIVTGHTDDRGNDATNAILSANRAEAVVLYLTRQGIARDRLQFIGAGESQPIADNSTAEGQRVNRRVELTAVSTL